MGVEGLGLLGLCAVFMPIAAALATGTSWVSGLPLGEATLRRVVSGALTLSLLASAAIAVQVVGAPGGPPAVTVAHWLATADYALEARLRFDLPAAVMMMLASGLSLLISTFSSRYLHRDPGYRRFFFLLPLFTAGMMAIAAGDTLDLVYAGWEVVGLASALLIAYFTEREAPVRHGLRAFAVYRVCDVALLAAAVLVHHHTHDATFSGGLHLPPDVARTVALLLVFASMGKAAAFPFTGWLPRAMEGPTPSSAIFYGALSIHAGPFLLLRAWPLLEPQPLVRGLLVAIGAVTAVHATMVGRAQNDVKSMLGYASVTQAAVILMEIGLGLPQLAMLHIPGHAVLRTWQLLQAPSALQAHKAVTGRLGGARPTRGWFWERVLPGGLRRFGYRLALERWFLADVAGSVGLSPMHRAFVALDRLDRAWTRRLAGREDTP